MTILGRARALYREYTTTTTTPAISTTAEIQAWIMAHDNALDEYEARTEARLSALEVNSHKPYDFTELVRRVDRLEGHVRPDRVQVSGEGSANLEQIELEFGRSGR